MQYLSKQQIIATAEKIFDSFTSVCSATRENYFFSHLPGKWSVAETIRHLVISTKTTTLAYKLPKFIVRLIGGKPNRISKSYEALVEKYKRKLIEGGKAQGIFVPGKISENYGREKLIRQWKQATSEFIDVVKNKTTETKLDDYLVKHPLLGKITLRELCYFTIYHTQHHLNIILNTPAEDAFIT